jgi:hypothetical protein
MSNTKRRGVGNVCKWMSGNILGEERGKRILQSSNTLVIPKRAKEKEERKTHLDTRMLKVWGHRTVYWEKRQQITSPFDASAFAPAPINISLIMLSVPIGNGTNEHTFFFLLDWTSQQRGLDYENTNQRTIIDLEHGSARVTTNR